MDITNTILVTMFFLLVAAVVCALIFMVNESFSIQENKTPVVIKPVAKKIAVKPVAKVTTTATPTKNTEEAPGGVRVGTVVFWSSVVAISMFATPVGQLCLLIGGCMMLDGKKSK